MLEQAPPIEQTEEIIPLLQDKPMTRQINSINDEYLYWDKIKYKAKNMGIDALHLWSAVKLSRLITAKTLTFGKYLFVFTSTDYIQKALHHLDLNIGGYLGSQGIIPEQDKNRYLVRSIMEEAISSSIIEGANTTRKKAKEMLLKETKPKNKSEQMILNNFHTIRHIVENQSDELTPEKLLQIHRLISRFTLDKPSEEGRFRDSNDIYVVDFSTSEAVHTPPDFVEIPHLIDDLCLFFNQNEGAFIHPIVKGIIIHFMIGWIHPFTDGNGRTARALFYWYLMKNGYWLTEYLSISRIIQSSKKQYEKAYLYTETDGSDLSYFITYNLKATEKAFDALKEYLHRKQQEKKDMTKYLKIPHVNERQANILMRIDEEPDAILNAKEMENAFAVSSFTARSDLNGLVALGFLEEVQVNKKQKNYIKSSHFEQLIKTNENK